MFFLLCQELTIKNFQNLPKVVSGKGARLTESQAAVLRLILTFIHPLLDLKPEVEYGCRCKITHISFRTVQSWVPVLQWP